MEDTKIIHNHTSLNRPCLSSLQDLGFQFYQEQNILSGLVSLPAYSGVRVSYLFEGTSQSKGLLQSGDLLLNAYTPFPMYGEVKNFSMASIGLHFTLLYRMTGIIPKECRIPYKIPESEPFYFLLRSLFITPQEHWTKYYHHSVRCNENRLSSIVLRQMERVDNAIMKFQSNYQLTFFDISDQMGISYRQLQRDFKDFLGMSPTEFERATRFYRAVEYLKELPPAQASIVAGYWDQSHMIKEFKELSGRTPNQIMQLSDIELPQLHILD